MAVKITQTGIDTVANSAVQGQTDLEGRINYDNIPAGSIIQVQSFNFTGTADYSGYAWHATPLAVNITPKYANSKIYVRISLTSSINAVTTTMGRLYKNGSVVTGALGNASGSRPQCWFKTSVYSTSWNSAATAEYLDTADTTNNIEYRLYICGHDSGRTMRINYNWSDADSNLGDNARATSQITVMEIRS